MVRMAAAAAAAGVRVPVQMAEATGGKPGAPPDNFDEAALSALRLKYARLAPEERATELVLLRGQIVGRRQGRAPRVFLDLQAGTQRLQLVVETPAPAPHHAPTSPTDSTDSTASTASTGPPASTSLQGNAILPLEVKPGVQVEVLGNPGRMPGRGAFALFIPNADGIVIVPDKSSGCPLLPAASLPQSPQNRGRGARARERASAAAYPRYHMSPSTVGWETSLGKLHIGAHNTMIWSGGLPLPEAPIVPKGALNCWLLPATDVCAVSIATHQVKLRAMGWRILTCSDVKVIERLSNKISFRDHARALGLLHHLPEHYASPEEAHFPCIVKGAEGNHGQNVKIIQNLELLQRKHVDTKRMLIQELIPGCVEISTSVLVHDGVVLDIVCVEYTYTSSVYVWPFVKEDKEKRASHSDIPAAHLAVMTKLLIGYSGIANFNYKVRQPSKEQTDDGGGGEIAIFEVNTRVGGDLGDDVPRWRARTFFEKLDSI